MAKSDGGDPDQGKSLAALAEQDQAAADTKAKAAAEDQSAEDTDDADDQDAADQAGDGKGQEPDENDPLMLAKWYDEITGSKEAENYANDHEWARGMKEGQKLVGKRSDQAKVGQQVLDAFDGREEDLLKLLATGKGGADKGDADKDGRIEFSQTWISRDEQGKLVAAPGAPPDALDRYARIQARHEEFITDPRAFVQRLLQPDLDKLQETQTKTTKELEQDREQAEVVNLCLANKALLYVDGNEDLGMTPQGTRVDEMVMDKGWKPKITDWVTRVETAIELVAGQKPPDRSRPTPKRAHRKTDAAATPPSEKTEKQLDEDLEKKGLAAVLLEQHKARKAVA